MPIELNLDEWKVKSTLFMSLARLKWFTEVIYLPADWKASLADPDGGGGRPVSIRLSICKRPSLISRLSDGMCLAMSSNAEVNEGL